MKTKLLIVSLMFFLVVFSAKSILKTTPEISEYVEINSEKMVSEDSPYDTMMQVLTHERCINCHPNDNIPKQGDASNTHYFGMSRGANDKGFDATKCATCHQKENNSYSGVPGAPHWALAPKSMAWEGLSPEQIAASMLDKSKNGNRSHEDLIHHLTEDKLVLWAFEPGVDIEGKPRTKPPISKEVYKTAVKEWFADGAIIPEK